MPLKVDSVEEPSLNLTPMLDVVLLLVIFFMVGTQFAEEESEFEVMLPTVSQAQPLTAAPDSIVVNVRRDGQILVDGRAISSRELLGMLRAAQQRYARQAVVVRRDGKGEYQNVMTVLDACRRAGIVNVQLANRVEDTGA
jgi:biopolymer transport protein ExbD